MGTEFDVARNHGTRQSEVPPVVGVAVMSELMLICAVHVQNGQKVMAKFIFERIREIARGENFIIYNEGPFKENLTKLTKAIQQL